MSKNKTDSPNTTNLNQERVLNAVAMNLFSESALESSTALNCLLNWSMSRDSSNPKTNPKITPTVVECLTNFVILHVDEWKKGPTFEAAVLALIILYNSSYNQIMKVNIDNAIILASSSPLMKVLLRLSYHPYSPLSRYSLNILALIARFCDISKIIDDPKQYYDTVFSLFMLADPILDEQLIDVFLNFCLNPNNLVALGEKVCSSSFICRLCSILPYPINSIRDVILEVAYTLAMTNSEFKDTICCSNSFLRILLVLTIPPYEPVESKNNLHFSPSQKACVFLIDLIEDPRVSEFLSKFKLQIAASAIKWKSTCLSDLAIRVSNTTTQ